MTPEERAETARAINDMASTKNRLALDIITETFKSLSLSAEEGESILGYLLGVSLGARQKSLTNNCLPARIMALAWLFAADVVDNEGENRI